MNPQPKHKAVRDKKYLKWLLTQPPVIGNVTEVYHHQTIRIPISIKGMAIKDHDCWAIPISNDAHDLINSGHMFFLESMKAGYVIDMWTRYNAKIHSKIIEIFGQNYSEKIAKNPDITLDIVNIITPMWEELNK